MSLEEQARETAKEQLQEPGGETRLGRVSTVLGIVVVLVAGLFWLFQVNATANYAKDKVNDHDKALEEKADKNEVRDGLREINRKLDQLNEYLLRNRTKR